VTDLKKPSVFLERRGYRQRRLRDVARMLPIFGGILWTIPLMWPERGDEAVGNATALQYIFGVWVLVIILTALIAYLIEPENDPVDRDGGG